MDREANEEANSFFIILLELGAGTLLLDVRLSLVQGI